MSVREDFMGTARAAIALAEPARAIGLRLAKRTAGALQYTPRVQFPS